MPAPKRTVAKKAASAKKAAPAADPALAAARGAGAGPADASGGNTLRPGPRADTDAGAQRSAAAGRRILLVDDDEEIVESMRTVLESKGYEIVVARDGNQGLLLAEREHPDLIVLDMMMPKRSGFLVLEHLRRTRAVPVKVVMITANEGSRHRAYAEMLGVDDYIRKPFAMDRLLATVQRLIGSPR